MHLKNPIFFYIFLIILFCLLLSVIIYKNFMQSAGAIFLKHVQYEKIYEPANPDFYIVSVTAEDLKIPFFGTAFHINYNPQDYTFDHFTLGDYFETQDDPMVLVNSNVGSQNLETGLSTGKIIVGISLKRGQLLTKPEGTLLKLYFKDVSKKNLFNNFRAYPEEQKPSNEFSFSNAVFSTFDNINGERKDVENITFYP